MGLILISILAVITIAVIVGFYLSNTQKGRGTRQVENQYKNKPKKLASINKTDAAFKYKLIDYYVASSYNSCCNGNFLNDYVSLETLKTVISQGPRVLDFEVYMVDNKPVVAASPYKSNNVKGTYNSVPLLGTNGALDVVNKYAFSLRTCPNYKDPIFINLRIKSDKMDYNALASEFNKIFGKKLLGPEYSFEGRGSLNNNVVNMNISDLMEKVIVICSQQSNNYRGTKFEEIVNLSDNSATFRYMRNYNIEFNNSPEGLEESNKIKCTLTMPDISTGNGKVSNVKATMQRTYGCQMICMNYQLLDDKMEEYLNYHNVKHGSAFVLKPEHLRYIPIKLKKPQKQNPELSHKAKVDKMDMYTTVV